MNTRHQYREFVGRGRRGGSEGVGDGDERGEGREDDKAEGAGEDGGRRQDDETDWEGAGLWALVLGGG